MSKPKLLDLCCGCGGAAVGYARAGFEVTGVDVTTQPDYPFNFYCLDALQMNYEQLGEFDVIHASPPCQQYSKSTAVARKRGKVYPDLFRNFKRMLVASGKPYVLENVLGSPARGIGLCGTMFGLGVFRHRVFESNIKLHLPERPCTCSGERIGNGYVTVAGDACTKAEALAAMGIDWHISSKDQLVEAIPPAYTEFLGQQILRSLASNNDEVRGLTTDEQQVLRKSSPRCSDKSEKLLLMQLSLEMAVRG